MHTGGAAVSLSRHNLRGIHHEQRVNTQAQILQQKIMRCSDHIGSALMYIQENLALKASRKEQPTDFILFFLIVDVSVWFCILIFICSASPS